MERTMPDAAYLALDALKRQAQAVTANNMQGDKEALHQAQSDMSLVNNWTTAITRKLLSNSDGRTIDTIDEQWLEQQFNG
ncbi:hypothetical protein [Vibrio parahaemolyticus]|uniref:hypothetical protein n=1 Tax=Vibrio parahaemolyticus TaxID=670 RepID=UPI00111CE2C3|nr:hypothetical protein [Vibrio parahaemolyticus]TOA68034.1 hypothetical protein CGK21_18945 [Vibrio parahaemolyticus]